MPAEVGHGYSTREQALAAVKKHLTTFKAAGHNPEGNYWWVRDSRRPAKVLDFKCRLKKTLRPMLNFPNQSRVL